MAIVHLATDPCMHGVADTQRELGCTCIYNYLHTFCFAASPSLESEHVSPSTDGRKGDLLDS